MTRDLVSEVSRSAQPVTGAERDLIDRTLRWNELFCHWPDEARGRLVKDARLRAYDRRTQVLAHDRHAREMLAVASGFMEVGCVDAEGRRYLHGLLGAGHIAAVVRLLEDEPLPYQYHAHEDSVIVHLTCDTVLAVLAEQPQLWREVARMGLQRHRYSLQALHDKVLNSIPQRLVVTLLRLAEYYGVSESGGVALGVRLSQHDLAAMLGVSRQTINRELGVLIEQGILDVSYNRIVIRDPLRLKGLLQQP